MRLAFIFLFISFHAISQSDQSLRFVQNKGQWNDDIDFQAQVPGGHLGVSAKGFSVVLLDMEELEHRHLASHEGINESSGHGPTGAIDAQYFQINLVGANPNAKAIAETPLDGHHNYFFGTDSCNWASNVLAYGSILYKNVYKGIDFRVSSVGRNLKYDFILQPGADPSLIKIEYCGVNGIDKHDEELKIETIFGTLTELKPVSYQFYDTRRETVRSQYKLHNNFVSFAFPDAYDECRELVIDPLLIFSTYSGSTADNWGSTATPGEHGTLYSAGVTSQTHSGNFPATPGAFQVNHRGGYDMAIIKYDSLGTRFLYATILGGFNNDSPISLVVDKNSNDLVVLGISSSPDFPTSANAFDKTFNNGTSIQNRVLGTTDQWDIVVTRLSRDGGQLIGSTFVGGSGNDGLNIPKQLGGPLVVNYGDEMRGDVITDEAGYVYISSVTASADFPIVNGFDDTFNGGTTDGVVVKFAPDLSEIIWSSYIGGSGFDAAYSLKFDNDQNIVIAGGTTSADFPATSGSYQDSFNGIVDGWIARISGDGSAITHATFTGTHSFDQVYFVDLNGDGNIFCYGQTAGQMPVTPGVYHNPNSGQFVQKFSPDLSALEFSTVFGSGSTNSLIIPNISPTAFMVNDCDNIYMTGWGGYINSSINQGFWQSSTHNMPITEDAHQKTTSGSDFYFIVLNGDASQLVYSTYFGGNSSKTHVDGGTSRFDKYGIVYHAVCSGCASGNSEGRSTSDFPTTANAKSRVNRSSNCNNAAFKFDLSSLRAVFETNNTELTMPGYNNVCYPEPIVFQNFSTGGRTFKWDFGDGRIVNQIHSDPRSLVHHYKEEGQYRVKLVITDLSTCSQRDSITKVINYFKDNIIISDDAMICAGETYQLTAPGGVDYTWTSEDGTFTSSEPSPVVQPESATTYFVSVVDADGCSRSGSITVDVTPNVHANFQTYDLEFMEPDFNNVCYPESLRFKNRSVNGEEYIWSFGDGTVVTQTKTDTVSLIHGFADEGTYHVKLKAVNINTCNKADSVVKMITYFKDRIIVGEDGEICEGTTFQLTASGGNSYTWYDDNRKLISSNALHIVRPPSTTQYFATITDANGCIRKDTVHVVVLDSVGLKWDHRLIANCVDRPYVEVRNLTPPSQDVNFHFDFGDGTISTENEVTHNYPKDGSYPLKFSAQRSFCIYEEIVQLPVYTLMVPNVFTPDQTPGLNDQFEIRFGSDFAPADIGIAVQLVVYDRWGKPVFESKDYKNDWNGNDLSGGVYYVYLKVGESACKSWLHILK